MHVTLFEVSTLTAWAERLGVMDTKLVRIEHTDCDDFEICKRMNFSLSQLAPFHLNTNTGASCSHSANT